MSLGASFNRSAASAATAPSKVRAKRPAPFSLRLSEAERSKLLAEAAGVPLGGYIKAKVLGTAPLKSRRSGGLAVEDRQALSQALALLGKSRLSQNLNQIAHAVNIGVLPVTPETEEDLRASLQAVQDMRTLLMRALGFAAEASP
jgi:hypothetical protein